MRESRSVSMWKLRLRKSVGIFLVFLIPLVLGIVAAAWAGDAVLVGNGPKSKLSPPKRIQPLPEPQAEVYVDEEPPAELAPAADGRVIRFVELTSIPLADANVATSDEAAYRNMLKQEKAAFRAEAALRGVGFVERLSFEVLHNGLSVDVAKADLAALEALDSVVATYPVYQFFSDGIPVAADPPAGTTRENVTVTTYTHVPEAHAAGYTGQGVVVGIIDGGIDYNHRALGGPGFPNSKVIGGWDFADNDPDPFDDSLGIAANHGTHVSGILAGSDEVMVGVAPDAQLRMYRIFGRNSGGSEDLVLAAMERAADDGCKVVNMSLGTSRDAKMLQTSAMARGADRLVKRGVVAVVAMGNGLGGPFAAGKPAIAKQTIGVASSYSSNISDLAFQLQNGAIVPYRIMYAGKPTPGSGSFPIVNFGVANCAALPPETSYEGKVVMVQRGASTCRTFTQVNLLAAAGAEAVLWWQSSGNPTTYPTLFSSTTNPMVIPTAGIRTGDAQAIALMGAGANMTWGFYFDVPTFAPGLPRHSSAWGPSFELDFKPDVMAPGGFVYSTLPQHAGFYGIQDGTSMACPHVAGVAALMLSANPWMKAHEVREFLLNTAVPASFNNTPALGLHPFAQQGAGFVDAVAAIAAAAKTSPAKLALGDLRGATRTETITVENKTHVAMTYTVSHVPALTAAPPFTSQWLPMTPAATVTITPATLVVPATGQANLTATFQEPANLPGGSIVSGSIELAPVGGGKSLRVPYIGLKGRYQEVPALNQTFTDINTTLDNPALRPEGRPSCSGPPPTRAQCCAQPWPGSCSWSVGKNLPLTLNYTNSDKYDDAAMVMVSTGFPMLRKFRASILDETGRRVAWAKQRVGTNEYSLLDNEEYSIRTSGAGTGIGIAQWWGDLEDGSPAPAGIYYVRIEFDKLQGDGVSYPDFETWLSPEITVVQP